MFPDDLAVVVVFLYGAGILALYFGWLKVADQKAARKSKPFVSIIIPYRNEAKNLKSLCSSLKQIQYPAEKLEIILVNDHSEDGGPELLHELLDDFPFQVHLPDNQDGQGGKKGALRTAATLANGEILLFSDADCRFQPEWVSSMMAAFNQDKIKLVQGPVFMEAVSTIPGRFEQIDYLSLMMSSAGSIGLGSGILASGANLAIKKPIYLQAGKSMKYDLMTGDDMFLLEFVKKNHPGSVSFNANREAVVMTDTSFRIQDFWNQRKRWSSKSLHYTDPAILFSAGLVFATNLLLMMVFLAGFLHPGHFVWFAILLILKSFFEWPLMSQGFRFYQIKQAHRWYLFTQIIYPFYVTSTAIFSLASSYQWKGRSK